MAQTLLQKLRLQPDQKVTILQRPSADYFAELNVSEAYPTEPVETIILFVKTIDEFKEQVLTIVKKNLLVPNGRLLIAYPKKGNKQFETFVHRDEIFPALKVDEEDGYIPGSDYKFNQMVKLDEIYTLIGLKRVTKKNTKTAASQSVGDYVAFIPTLEKELAAEPQALEFFKSLTPGYQRNWARYVYSAKQEATQVKRKQEMIDLLKQGIKYK
ncbi:hypothetical protein BAU15_08220 [Enterococcus sp. JM4C]|uniref:YdeI/OmpD-associated family protein n=1 Tax=Candidatus Enterococcus huntleyi TaxID=1857217 RepID=UPI001379FEB6|nr:YdeI/OmpD-associated family protein [Enterococcus sp. JM4C]KAF1297880.1 hypothetical protein BAU15_08220 [Enterococcus sp. JM4C]